MRETLRSVYDDSLSDYDCACLKWWARNRIALEKRVDDNPRVLMVNYDRLVADKTAQFHRIFAYIGLTFRDDMVAFVHQRSLRKDLDRPLNEKVKTLCEQMMSALDAAYERSRTI